MINAEIPVTINNQLNEAKGYPSLNPGIQVIMIELQSTSNRPIARCQAMYKLILEFLTLLISAVNIRPKLSSAQILKADSVLLKIKCNK